MRFLIVLIFATLLFSCNNGITDESENVKQILIKGEWKLVESDVPYQTFRNGLKFSDNNHIFLIDSQGHTVPSAHEIIYSINMDTLKIIDYKYDQHHIYDKGTSIYIIKEITEEKLVLDMLHPDTPNRLIFENFK